MTNPNESRTELNARRAGTVTLGDIPIARMGFGTMRLPGPGVWGMPHDPQEARNVLRRAVDLGVNYLDTASFYGPLVSDSLIVEALYPYPEGLVIGTKVGAWRGSDKSWIFEARPEQLKTSVEDNLDRLRLEQLSLVHLRYNQPSGVPFEDSLGALIELRQAGKIRHIGLSGVTLEHLTAAQKVVPIVSVQNLYNLVDRRDEPVLEHCTQQGIPYMPFFPLATGSLGHEIGPLSAIARKYQVAPAQVALAWLCGRSPQMVLIPGTRSVVHLEENIASLAIQLDAEEQQALEDSAEIVSGWTPPHR
jgi:aryl-alcohol dehydrogenase-like predicted oxidoreductase